MSFGLLVLFEVCNNVSAVEVPPVDCCPKDSPNHQPNYRRRSEIWSFLTGEQDNRVYDQCERPKCQKREQNIPCGVITNPSPNTRSHNKKRKTNGDHHRVQGQFQLAIPYRKQKCQQWNRAKHKKIDACEDVKPQRFFNSSFWSLDLFQSQFSFWLL